MGARGGSPFSLLVPTHAQVHTPSDASGTYSECAVEGGQAALYKPPNKDRRDTDPSGENPRPRSLFRKIEPFLFPTSGTTRALG